MEKNQAFSQIQVKGSLDQRIRKVLSKKIVMKFLPKILFVKDESFEYAEKIENLIKQTYKQGTK